MQYSGSRLSVCFQYIRKVRGIFHLHPGKGGLHQAGNVVEAHTLLQKQGHRLNGPQKGINIVKRGNKTMKVIIK